MLKTFSIVENLLKTIAKCWKNVENLLKTYVENYGIGSAKRLCLSYLCIATLCFALLCFARVHPTLHPTLHPKKWSRPRAGWWRNEVAPLMKEALKKRYAQTTCQSAKRAHVRHPERREAHPCPSSWTARSPTHVRHPERREALSECWLFIVLNRAEQSWRIYKQV